MNRRLQVLVLLSLSVLVALRVWVTAPTQAQVPLHGADVGAYTGAAVGVHRGNR